MDIYNPAQSINHLSKSYHWVLFLVLNQRHIEHTLTGAKAPFTTATPQTDSWEETQYKKAIVNQAESDRDEDESMMTTPVADPEMIVGIQQTDTDVARYTLLTQQVSLSPSSRT